MPNTDFRFGDEILIAFLAQQLRNMRKLRLCHAYQPLTKYCLSAAEWYFSDTSISAQTAVPHFKYIVQLTSALRELFCSISLVNILTSDFAWIYLSRLCRKRYKKIVNGVNIWIIESTDLLKTDLMIFAYHLVSLSLSLLSECRHKNSLSEKPTTILDSFLSVLEFSVYSVSFFDFFENCKKLQRDSNKRKGLHKPLKFNLLTFWSCRKISYVWNLIFIFKSFPNRFWSLSSE